VVETVGHNFAGEEVLSLSHFPVNSSGQSLIALAVAAATPSGTILPSNRTGSSSDLPGAASDTSVPEKSTSGTPFYEQGSGGSYWAGAATEAGGGGGGSADPHGGAGAPEDSAPTPGSGPTSPVLRLASSSSGFVKPAGPNALGGDSLCPYGYSQISGTFSGGQVLQADMATCGQTTSFVATSFPSVNFGPWETYGIFKVQNVYVSWNHPTEGLKEATTQSIISQNPSVPFECIFSIIQNNYTCKLSNGTAGPTVTKKLYKVVAGDTMASISQRMYGTTSRATDILNANQIGSESLFGLTLSGADWLMWPGLILTIPD
jgi:nucleoid-associated protein YgaU